MSETIRKYVYYGFIIGTVMFLVFLVINLIYGVKPSFDYQMLKSFGYYQLYAIVLTFVNGYYFDYLNHQVKWGKYKNYRLITGVVGGIVLTMTAVFVLRVFTEIIIEGENWNEFLATETKTFYLISLLITFIFTLFFHALYFYRELHKNRVKEQKVIAGTATAKFDALKNQLDPHFLFNSLNVLSSLIDENPENAQLFTADLSKIYRYVLEQKDKELVTVNEELQFARTYVGLLKMRFEDSIIFEIPEKASNPEARVVPLSLQLLLENAVKHNTVTPNKPLKINIYEEDGNLVIANNLQEKTVLKKGSGVGLQNIKQRYALLTYKQPAIEKNKQEFKVKIPMLTKQVSNSDQTRFASYMEDKRYENAKKHVNALKGFYSNVLSYIIIIPLLAWLNYKTTDFPWIIFPIAGWGLGIVLHGMEVYGYNPVLGKNWEKRKIKEFMEKDKFK